MAINWKKELADNSKEVYKLTIVNNPDIIQGLLSLTIRPDHILMDLVESAPFNIGRNKLYEGVAGNLVAHAVNYLFNMALTVLYHLQPKPGLLNIMKKH